MTLRFVRWLASQTQIFSSRDQQRPSLCPNCLLNSLVLFGWYFPFPESRGEVFSLESLMYREVSVIECFAAAVISKAGLTKLCIFTLLPSNYFGLQS